MTSKSLAAGVLTLAMAVMVADTAVAGTISIVSRESFGEFGLFAGSGGAVEQVGTDSSSAALTGAFAFSDSGAVSVAASNPFSNGSANADGSINITDNVSQASASTLSLSATRAANGTAEHTSGTGTGLADMDQTFIVTFDVVGDDATYNLTGNFDPGAASNGTIFSAGRVALIRPFTANKKFDFNTAATFNETGTLTAGLTYRLIVRMNDSLSAPASNPFQADTSSLDLQFNVTSIPEPATATLLALTPALLRRRVRRL